MSYVIRAAAASDISEREKENAKIAREAAREGMVLLENGGIGNACVDNAGICDTRALPLQKGQRVALYGAGARVTIKGGTGSGEVKERHSVGIEEGLENAGFVISTKKWLDDYDTELKSNHEEWHKKAFQISKWANPFDIFNVIAGVHFQYPFGRLINEDDITSSCTDTAIYVVSRQAGEGADRRTKPGDYILTEVELANIKIAAERYEKTIVVINVGGMIDLSFMDEIKGINALIYFVQEGMEGGNAFADIALGTVSPSGKLTDTWAKKYEDYPGALTFSYNNGNLVDEDYNEGIYVGYRYFDAFNVEPRYPFGYGKSYTDFSISVLDTKIENTKAIVNLRVVNTGERFPGKEIIQLYLSSPAGKLEKEIKSLAAFAKTGELQPGQSEDTQLSFDFADFASYDEEAASYLLEAGDYILWAGNNSRDIKAFAIVSLGQTVVTETCENICALKRNMEFAKAPARTTPNIASSQVSSVKRLELLPSSFSLRKNVYTKPSVSSNPRVVETLSKLSVKEKIELVVGIGYSGKSYNIVPGSVGNTTSRLVQKGIKNIVMADGPAGLNVACRSVVSGGRAKPIEVPVWYEFGLGRFAKSFFCAKEGDGPVYYQYCTAWPVQTALAQSWNLPLLEKVGKAVGREMDELGIHLWLAPALNIHRNPLCGRNFEYYSEDPVLSGLMASAITKGVQSFPQAGVTIKHFACNNQEDNRMDVSSNLGERALREIYLKAFRIAARDSKPAALMTSYNKVNDVYSPNSYELCTKVLRCEWDFEGLVMTDWIATEPPHADHRACMSAGNDLIMPGSSFAKRFLKKGLAQGVFLMDDLDRSAGRVLETAFKLTEKLSEETSERFPQ